MGAEGVWARIARTSHPQQRAEAAGAVRGGGVGGEGGGGGALLSTAVSAGGRVLAVRRWGR